MCIYVQFYMVNFTFNRNHLKPLPPHSPSLYYHPHLRLIPLYNLMSVAFYYSHLLSLEIDKRIAYVNLSVAIVWQELPYAI